MSVAARGEKRRLAAILAADVVGYARLIAEDEWRTLDRLRGLFREVVQPLTAAHGGRIFRLLGDAVLVEFPSAVDALRCALAWQEVMARSDGAPRIVLRIGIALGDAVVEGGDLYGDVVNIAARLQALAEPGGVLVSEAVACQAHGRVVCAMEDAGRLALKNIPHPLHGFRIRPGTSLPVVEPPPSERASLLVLPFAPSGGGSMEARIADGITDELTTALARLRWFHVIARTAAADDVRGMSLPQLGREFQVRYMLKGRVRPAGDKLRVSGQLIEAASGRHLWADRFDAAAEDVLALQDRLAEAVTGFIEPTLARAELERLNDRPVSALDAYGLFVRALPLRQRLTREDNSAAITLLRQAMALDHGFAPARAHALGCVTQRVIQGWGEPGEGEDGIRLAHECLRMHGDDPLALTAAAEALGRIAFDPDGALEIASRAVALDPTSFWAESVLGWAQLQAGLPDDAVAHFERALRLRPHDSDAGQAFAGLGHARLMLGRPAEALALGEKALRTMPVMAEGHRLMVVALAELGRPEAAAAAAARFVRLVPNARADANFRRLFRDQAFAERAIRAFRAAGLPD